jgi:hypothetical protein
VGYGESFPAKPFAGAIIRYSQPVTTIKPAVKIKWWKKDGTGEEKGLESEGLDLNAFFRTHGRGPVQRLAAGYGIGDGFRLFQGRIHPKDLGADDHAGFAAVAAVSVDIYPAVHGELLRFLVGKDRESGPLPRLWAGITYLTPFSFR